MTSTSTEDLERYCSIDIDPEGYFEGLSKQSMKFHNALAELVDNSISANIDDGNYFDDRNPGQDFRVQITIERYQDHTSVIVADSGRGMSANKLEDHILRQGDRQEAEGILNEHGMGLKNSLAVLTRNEGEEPFYILTRSATDSEVEKGQYVRVSGPFSERMTIEAGSDSSEWTKGAGSLENTTQGTRVHIRTTHDMVRSAYRSARHLGSIIPGIRERLGTIYRHFLLHSDNNHIHIHWRDNVRDESGQTSVRPIWPVFRNGEDADGRSWYEEDQIEVTDEDGTTYSVSFNRGIADWEATRERYESGEFEGLATSGDGSPFRIHYRGTQATQGVDIVYNGRTLNTDLMDEIWDSVGANNESITTHNRFNNFIGEVVITDQAFETVNNKVEINQEGQLWRQLTEKLNRHDEFYPRAYGRAEKEDSIKKLLKQKLDTFPSTSRVHREYGCDNGVNVDILQYYEEGYQYLYEVKRDKARPLDIYQLVMYWDSYGRADDSDLRKGILVARSISGNAEAMIERWNNRLDEQGSQYNFEFQQLSEYELD